MSTAEYIFKFQTETPERFRTLSRKSQHPASAAVDESVQSSKADVTMPYTPKLQTKTRARPTIVRSAAELEEEELSKIRRYPPLCYSLSFSSSSSLPPPFSLKFNYSQFVVFLITPQQSHQTPTSEPKGLQSTGTAGCAQETTPPTHRAAHAQAGHQGEGRGSQ